MGDGGADERGGSEVRRAIANGGRRTLDELFDVLAHRRRRLTLYYLREHDPTSLDELAASVAAWERDQSPETVGAERRQSVRTDLYHRHLPRLADAAIVEHDRRTGTVRCRDVSDPLGRFLDQAAAFEDVTLPGSG